MKRIVVVFALTIFLSFVVYPLRATTSRMVYEVVDEEGISVRIEAPFEAYPNDTMTIRIKVQATEDLQEVTVHFKIYGSESGGNITWFRRVEALTNRDLLWSGTGEDQPFDVDIPDDVDPGILHGHVYCSWKVFRGSSWQEQSIDDVCVHRVTYLRNRPYEDLQVAYNQLLTDYDSLQTSYDYLENSHNDLQANYSTLLTDYGELLVDYNNLQEDYDSLNSTYNSLLSDYSSLQSKFNELKSKYEFGGEMANTLNLTYVFIETTVIFIATTIYYARSQIYSALRRLKPEEQVVDVNPEENQQA